LVRAGDLVFTCWGTIGQVGRIPDDGPYEQYVISNKQLKLRTDPAVADSKFVFYYVASKAGVEYIVRRSIGAAVPGINLGILKSIPIALPQIEVQTAIVSILSAYDDLIANNRRRIALLEQAARLLYREWFVHFRFPGHESAKLVDEGFKHISTGNLLRAETAAGTELGKKVSTILEEGQLVSDEIVVELLKANLKLNEDNYIFDGYPRNEEQAKTLSEILGDHKYKAVFFDIDTDILVERLAGRRTTKDGKYIYNVVSNPPKVDGICDVTGEELIQRDDDKEEVVRKRLDVYKETMQGVLSFYEKRDALVKIDANRDVDSVFASVMDIVKN
jgi:adenylate kinase